MNVYPADEYIMISLIYVILSIFAAILAYVLQRCKARTRIVTRTMYISTTRQFSIQNPLDPEGKKFTMPETFAEMVKILHKSAEKMYFAMTREFERPQNDQLLQLPQGE
ncbi:hypothetical protein ACOME3_000329 [Neoechinorhynchus agilis]